MSNDNADARASRECAGFPPPCHNMPDLEGVWCEDCQQRRIAHLDKQFATLSAPRAAMSTEQEPGAVEQWFMAEGYLDTSLPHGPGEQLRAFARAHDADDARREKQARLEATEAALELAAQVADDHWPERGHEHVSGAISCQASISVAIRRLKLAAIDEQKAIVPAREALLARLVTALTDADALMRDAGTRDPAYWAEVDRWAERYRAALAAAREVTR